MHFSSLNDTDDLEDIFDDNSEIGLAKIPNLTEGVLLKFHRGSKNENNLILQVLKLIWMPFRKQYKLDVSDGKYYISTALLDKVTSNLIHENHTIDEFSVINIKR